MTNKGVSLFKSLETKGFKVIMKNPYRFKQGYCPPPTTTRVYKPDSVLQRFNS